MKRMGLFLASALLAAVVAPGFANSEILAMMNYESKPAESLKSLKLTGPRDDGRQALEDLHIGFGVGARARVAYLPLRFDLGWRTDGVSVSRPELHFFIGPEF